LITEENLCLYPGDILSCSPISSEGFPDVSHIETKHYANDNIINFWIGLLRELDRKMTIENPLRKTTLFIDSLNEILNNVSKSNWEDIILYKKII
jgi:hypothetical protein